MSTTRLIIDTDVALGAWHEGRPRDVDDGFALVSAINHPGVELAGVTTVFGNAPHADVVRIAREIMALKGDPAPVFAGAAEPLPQSGPMPPANEAVQFMAARLVAGEHDIAAIGPLTNLGLLVHHHRSLLSAIGTVFVVAGRSAGAHFYIGDTGPVRDFNFENDVRAARLLLESGVDVVLGGFELTRQVAVTETDLETIAARGNPVAAYFHRNALAWCRHWAREFGETGFHPWDSAAVSWFTDNHHFLAEQRGWRIIEHEDGWRLECDPAYAAGPVTYVTGFTAAGLAGFVSQVVANVY